MAVASMVRQVTAEEADRFSLPASTATPAAVMRKVRLGQTGRTEQLLAAGVVPSAEVLAELVPALTAPQVLDSYPDARLGRLMAATYEAFRRRRSLLLLDLARQVQFGELPWVQAVASYASARPDDSTVVGTRVATLAIEAFPGTILPNPLIQELGTLFGAGGLDLPLTEELAADIFMGRFSGRFAAAARIAATMLRGTLYERYYDLEYDEVLALPPPQPESGPRSKRGRSGEPAFDAICARTRGEAAPGGRSWSVAGNGLVIERQQLLTTHNLAVLVDRAGVVPQRGWLDLAVQAARLTARLLDLAQRQPRPLSTVKDAAYAWRQSLFFLTMAGGDTTQTGELIERLQELRAGRRWPMTEVLAGLAHVADGSRFDRDGRSPGGRRLLGWTIAPHWALAERESAPIRSA